MFKGSIVALVTPMKANGEEVDLDALRRLIEFHIEQGTNAIGVAGTTGESGTLTDSEKKLVIITAIEQAKQRVPIIAGTAGNSTMHTIELTRMAMECGADAALIMTPYYIKPTQEGLFLHYQAVAHAVAIPQILYNIPSRTACDLLPATVEKLAVISNIIGIKEGTGKLDRVVEIKNHCGDNLDIYSGDDVSAKDLILLGGKGVISVTANIAPKLMSQMCHHALAKDEALANELNDKLMQLHQALFVETNPIPVKWAMAKLGLIAEAIRLPLTNLSSKFHEQVQDAMNRFDFNYSSYKE